MINFIINFLIGMFIVAPGIGLLLLGIQELFTRKKPYVEPEKPYTIEDWLCSKH